MTKFVFHNTLFVLDKGYYSFGFVLIHEMDFFDIKLRDL